MAKPRRKKRHLDMDFVVSQPIEACAYRLGHLEERREIAFVPHLSLRLRQVDENTYQFELHEKAPAPISVFGVLNRLDHNQTYVSGVAVIHYGRLYIEAGLVLLLILGLALVVGPLMLLFYLPLLLYFMARYRRGAADEFWRLIHLLRGMLG